MKVRPAHKSDLTIIHQINEANTPHVSSVSLEWLEKYLKEAFYFNVIEFQRKVAGFMIAMLPDTDYQSENFLWFKKNYASFVYVDRIAIHPEHFKKGLGKALYKDLEQSMKTQSKVLTCEVNLRPENPRSLHFHQSLGFQEVGQLETKGGSVRVSLLGKTVNYY